MNKEPVWLTIARKEIGVHETPGPKATARIVEYGKATTLKPSSDEVPWCSIFVNWCLQQAGLKGTESALASSWLDWGVELEYGEPGAITLISRDGGSGYHVGFYISEDTTGVNILGGNQADSVSIKHFPWWRVINFRFPRKEVQECLQAGKLQ